VTDGARLDVESLDVQLGGASVLAGVSLTAPAGRTTAVLGPSGGGKSTLLRAVAGLIRPSTGRVLLDGVDVTSVPAHRRGVGLAFQDLALFPHRDVGANIGFGLRMQGVTGEEIARRTAEVLDLVGLPGFARRGVDTLSGGEAQRVALARALAPGPGVLCLDEPLAALDRVLHDRLVGELHTLFATVGTTVVLVTHDQREALALADHLVVLGSGYVLQAGPPQQVWDQPATEEVARFVGHEVVDDWRGGGRVVLRPGAIRVTGVADTAGVRVVDAVFAGGHTTLTLDVPDIEGLVTTEVTDPTAPQWRGMDVTVEIDESRLWHLGR
jgi:thiamine transport system ATP-binding protein